MTNVHSQVSKLGYSVEALTKALRENPDLYYVYQSNIAMAFQDEWTSQKISSLGEVDIHTIANRAAKNFLNMWIGE